MTLSSLVSIAPAGVIGERGTLVAGSDGSRPGVVITEAPLCLCGLSAGGALHSDLPCVHQVDV